MIQQGTIIPIINEKIVSEYVEVLSRSKFHLSISIVNKIVQGIVKYAISVDEEHIDIELPDEKDRVFYEVTMKSNEERDSMLVTGNIKHFPKESFIVTPKELLDIIYENIDKA